MPLIKTTPRYISAKTLCNAGSFDFIKKDIWAVDIEIRSPFPWSVLLPLSGCDVVAKKDVWVINVKTRSCGSGA